MRRLGRGFGRGHWVPADWARAWVERGPHAPSAEQLLRRNELQAFRVVLAKKEPRE